MEAECEMLLLALLKCWKCWSRFLLWVSSLELRNQEVAEAGGSEDCERPTSNTPQEGFY